MLSYSPARTGCVWVTVAEVFWFARRLKIYPNGPLIDMVKKQVRGIKSLLPPTAAL